MEDISLLVENLYAIPTHKTTKKITAEFGQCSNFFPMPRAKTTA